MEVETKSLRLQTSKGKVEQEYSLELDLPSKEELIQLLELPPHYILSKNEITFSSGLLAQTPHALKLLISRDYQDLYIGLFIKVGEKEGQQVQIPEIKGIFQPLDRDKGNSSSPPSTSARNNAPIVHTISNPSVLRARDMEEEDDHDHDEDDLSMNHDNIGNGSNNVNVWYQPGVGVVHHPIRVHHLGHPWHNHLPFVAVSNSARDIQRIVGATSICQPPKKGLLFSFQKQNPEMRFEDLKNFTYYRSYCQTWPVRESRLKLILKVTGIKYSAIVDEEEMLVPNVKKGSGNFNAESFFMSEHCSDVKLKIGSAVIPAHKIVLSARSDYFNRMFSSPMKEASESCVELQEDDFHFAEVIRFIYTGRVERISEHASELFFLADKYQIEELTNYCEKYLLSKLSVENVIELFDLSHSVGKQGLLAKKAKEIIKWNKEKFAPDLETFKEFFNKYPELLFEILKL